MDVDEFQWDGERWQPKTARAAVELMRIALGGAKDAADLAEDIVQADGLEGRSFTTLGALSESLENIVASADVAYMHAYKAVEWSSDKNQGLAVFSEFWTGVSAQFARVPAIVERANIRAEREGFARGFVDGYNKAVSERSTAWDAALRKLKAMLEAAGEHAMQGFGSVAAIGLFALTAFVMLRAR